MVHALSQIKNGLKPEGLLIDLRPLADNWPVEIVWEGETRQVGRITDLPTAMDDDLAAENAIAKASHNGWFARRDKKIFPFYYYWDSPEEMDKFVKENWGDFAILEPDVIMTAQSVWQAATANRRVRIRRKMQLSSWDKIGSEILFK